MSNFWKQGQQVEILITDLADTGNGVGRVQERVVFVPDTVPGDRVLIRLLKVKPKLAEGKLLEVLEPSSHRIRPHCIVADKCGGCQWQHVEYSYQLQVKRNLVIQTLQRIGGFDNPPVDEVLSGESDLGYRNKVSYPFGISETGQVRAGYYQKNSHRLINLNQCPVQDQRLNPLLAEVKQDIEKRGWSIYNEQKHQGELRHLSLRIGRRTGEMLLTLIATKGHLLGLQEQAYLWLKRYPQLVGVCLNLNPHQTNVIFGKETRCIAGQPLLQEIFAGLEFHLRSDTFFQVNTEVAEALLGVILDQLNLQGHEKIIDAYCGIGTLTLPLAQNLQQQHSSLTPHPQVIGIEVHAASVEQAQLNATVNHLKNVIFHAGNVQKILPQLDFKPDIIVLDPPRKGCDRAILEILQQIRPSQIVYMSCKPATLARDLKLLCQTGMYQLTRVQPADFFPQTPHVECVAFLQKSSSL